MFATRLSCAPWWALLALVMYCAMPAPLQAQETAAAEPAAQANDSGADDVSTGVGAGLTVEKVQQALAQQPEPTADAPPSRDYTDLKDALEMLNQEAEWQSNLEKLKRTNAQGDNLDQKLNETKNEAAEMDSRMLPNTQDETDQAIKQAAPKLQELKDSVSELETRINTGPQRRVQQSQRFNELKKLMGDSNADPSDTSPAGMKARAELQAQQAEADFLQLSIATADARKTIQNRELEIARIRLEALNKWSDRLKAHLAQLSEDSLKKQQEAIREVARSAAKESPVLARLAQRNQELLNRRKELAGLLRSIDHRSDYYEDLAQRINSRLNEIQQRVKISGFSQAAAELMLKELRRLPMMNQLESEQLRLEDEVRDTQLELVDLSDDLTAQMNPVQQMQELGLNLSPEEASWVRDHEDMGAMAELLEQGRAINADLRNDANKYFDALLGTDSQIMSTMQATENFREFASENILWIPSRNTLSVRDANSLPKLMNSAEGEFTQMLDNIIRGPVLRAIAFVLFVILLALAVKYAAKWTRSDRVAPINPGKFLGTAKIVAFEVCVSFTPVIVLRMLAWAVNDPKLDSNFSNALEAVAVSAAPAAFFITLLYRITLPGGLASSHLRWPRAACERINKAMKYYLLPALLFGMTSVLLDQYALYTDQQSGSRFFMLPSFLLCWVALHTVFSPRQGILAISEHGERPWGPGMRWTVYLFFMGWQGFLSLLVIGGYMLGAVMLWSHTFRTIWLVAAILIVKALVIRYLQVQQWTAQQQEAEEKAKGELPDEKPMESPSFVLEDSTKQVIGFLQWVVLILGISAVWNDAFPSLRKLGSQSAFEFGESSMLSWGQVGMLVICLITTVLLARSLPRLLEILVLRRISRIDPGSRHAFSTLLVYLVVIIGLIWASSILRVEWDKIQWLVAAISVGLGFGMQEIFGNLVAGIILLFERPIRVGDIVTVGQTTGKVTRIQMRGTTIMEWDRRELIVPNKEFVTGQLTNWTLSDTLTRLTLNVGVAYGSDIGQVKTLLLETIKKDARVLEDPAPAVFFKEFGESSLDFLCFAYLGTLDDRLGATSDLQQAIYEALNNADITIPFPQRDLHIIDAPPGLFGGKASES